MQATSRCKSWSIVLLLSTVIVLLTVLSEIECDGKTTVNLIAWKKRVCKTLCLHGQGGMLCNCDLPPGEKEVFTNRRPVYPDVGQRNMNILRRRRMALPKAIGHRRNLKNRIVYHKIQ
ncbi:Uncharacterised protein g2852 [Pycnogonum litorale]